ncbi:MAG: hypothetical protein CL855_00645 [Cryomorphaceae bacterium]|nr:hypothetical protein [Cryomorphaceae bacterium]
MPALYGAKAISTGLAALGLGATFLPPAIDFAKNYAKKGRTKGQSRMSQFGGTDFTVLPGGSNFEEGVRPGDIDRQKITTETSTPLTSQQFDNTLEGQYQRYFQTPEFNNVFGAGSRGKGAPQDASAMEELGNQLRAPETDTNIASMYASQSALGRVNQDEIQDYFSDSNLPGNVKKEGAELSALQQWAKVNPMLAQREYLKAEQRRADAIGNERERVQLDNPMGKEAYDLIKKQLLNKAAAQ